MGKKRGMHVVQIGPWFAGGNLGRNIFTIIYKRSKCRHAKTHRTAINAIDELDAYRKIKRINEGANQ
jgi:hypothetical protein